MKFIIVALALVAAVAAQQAQPVPYVILRQTQDSSPDGSYQFSYETDNGISVSEEGQPGPDGEDGRVVVVHGRFSYPAPDGTPITVTYTADETGFHPEGEHLPTSPPIPEAIARSIQLNAASAASAKTRIQRAQPQTHTRRG